MDDFKSTQTVKISLDALMTTIETNKEHNTKSFSLLNKRWHVKYCPSSSPESFSLYLVAENLSSSDSNIFVKYKFVLKGREERERGVYFGGEVSHDFSSFDVSYFSGVTLSLAKLWELDCIDSNGNVSFEIGMSDLGPLFFGGGAEVVIDNFTEKCELAQVTPQQTTPIITINGSKWRLIYFPLGNDVDSLSVYVEAIGSEKRVARFRLTLFDITGIPAVKWSTRKEFNGQNMDHGWHSLLSQSQISTVINEFDQVRFYLEVNIEKDVPKKDFDGQYCLVLQKWPTFEALLRDGKPYDSEPFKIGKFYWKLQIVMESKRKFFAAFLKVLGLKKCLTRFQLSLVGSDDKSLVSDSGVVTFDSSSPQWGFDLAPLDDLGSIGAISPENELKCLVQVAVFESEDDLTSFQLISEDDFRRFEGPGLFDMSALQTKKIQRIPYPSVTHQLLEEAFMDHLNRKNKTGEESGSEKMEEEGISLGENQCVQFHRVREGESGFTKVVEPLPHSLLNEYKVLMGFIGEKDSLLLSSEEGAEDERGGERKLTGGLVFLKIFSPHDRKFLYWGNVPYNPEDTLTQVVGKAQAKYPSLHLKRSPKKKKITYYRADGSINLVKLCGGEEERGEEESGLPCLKELGVGIGDLLVLDGAILVPSKGKRKREEEEEKEEGEGVLEIGGKDGEEGEGETELDLFLKEIQFKEKVFVHMFLSEKREEKKEKDKKEKEEKKEEEEEEKEAPSLFEEEFLLSAPFSELAEFVAKKAGVDPQKIDTIYISNDKRFRRPFVFGLEDQTTLREIVPKHLPWYYYERVSLFYRIIPPEEDVNVVIALTEHLYSNTSQYDILDFESIPSLKCKPFLSFFDIRKKIGKDLSLPPNQIALRSLCPRKNETKRLGRRRKHYHPPITAGLSKSTRDVRVFAEVISHGRNSSQVHPDEQKSFASFSPSPFLPPPNPLNMESDDKKKRNSQPISAIGEEATLLLHLKYFDLKTGSYSYLGHGLFLSENSLFDVVRLAEKLLGLEEEEEEEEGKGEEKGEGKKGKKRGRIILKEEICPNRIEKVESFSQTIKDALLINGDILIVEENLTEEEREILPYRNVENFLRDTLSVRFCERVKRGEKREGFSRAFLMHHLTPYAEIAEKISQLVESHCDEIQFFRIEKDGRRQGCYPGREEVLKDMVIEFPLNSPSIQVIEFEKRTAPLSQTLSFSCPICYERYTKEARCPNRFECGHTLCFECLFGMLKGESLSCPFCYQVFPHGGDIGKLLNPDKAILYFLENIPESLLASEGLNEFF